MGAPPCSDQVPLLEECENDDQASVNTPPLTHENMRIPLLQMDQARTTPTQASTAQSQVMTARTNKEIIHCPNQQVATMTSRLRDFTRMNCPTFYGS